MSSPVEKHQAMTEAIRAWYFDDDPQKALTYLRGRHQQLHEDYWEIKRENIDLWHENQLLRQGQIPESVSWITAKIANQRKAIRALRKKLGYKDD